ncbi:MAG: hypothetical protein ACRC7N_19755 [Clostridium sp.]
MNKVKSLIKKIKELSVKHLDDISLIIGVYFLIYGIHMVSPALSYIVLGIIFISFGFLAFRAKNSIK